MADYDFRADVLAGRANSIEAKKAEQLRDNPIPPPEVTAREPAEGEIPASAKSLRKLAEANGFKTRMSYARGPYLHANGRTVLRVVDSLLLQMCRGHEQRATAAWVTSGKGAYAFEFAYAANPLRKLNSAELRAYIKGASQ